LVMHKCVKTRATVFKMNKLFFYLCLLIISASILYFQPWYGLMDDASLLDVCRSIKAGGVASTFHSFLVSDLSWGMLRPLYFIMINLLYCTTLDHPVALYLLNFLFVMALTLFLIHTLFSLYIKKEKIHFNTLALAFVFTVLFYRFHDLLLHPSLQEKIVLLFGALNLLFFSRKNLIHSNFTYYILGSILLVLGFLSKAQFLIFIPALYFILILNFPIRRGWGNTLKHIWFLFILFLGVFLLKQIASHGSYTQSYGFNHVFENLKKPTSICIFMFSIIGFIFNYKFFYGFQKKERVIYSILPISFFLSFLVVFSPWTISDGYLLSILAPFFGVQLYFIVQVIKKYNEKLYPFLAVSLMLLAVFVTSYRSVRNFSRWGDLGKILFSQELKSHLNQNNFFLIVPCEEGAQSVKKFLKFYSDFDSKKVLQTLPNHNDEGFKDYLFLGDSSLCPYLKTPAQKSLLIPSFSKSFQLYY